MARVTVEDCIEKVPNRFELVMLSSQRARQIGAGSGLKVDRDNDKNPVVALREIAEEEVKPDDLKEELTKTHQRVIEVEDTEEVIDLMEGEEEWNAIAANKEDGEDSDKDEKASLNDVAGG